MECENRWLEASLHNLSIYGGYPVSHRSIGTSDEYDSETGNHDISTESHPTTFFQQEPPLFNYLSCEIEYQITFSEQLPSYPLNNWGYSDNTSCEPRKNFSRSKDASTYDAPTYNISSSFTKYNENLCDVHQNRSSKRCLQKNMTTSHSPSVLLNSSAMVLQNQSYSNRKNTSKSRLDDSPYRLLSETVLSLNPAPNPSPNSPPAEYDSSSIRPSLSNGSPTDYFDKAFDNDGERPVDTSSTHSVYSLDQLDMMRGRTWRLPSVPADRHLPVTSQYTRRMNNEYTDEPLNSRATFDSEDSKRSAQALEPYSVASEDNTRGSYYCSKPSMICSTCFGCRGLCCSRSGVGKLPRKYVGSQEISAECAIDW